jgi:hypothetical protein
MSDVSQGEGWWLASDGKWYPPESRPMPAPPPPPPPSPIHPSSDQAGAIDGGGAARPFISLNKTLSGWTRGLMWANGAAALMFALLANYYRESIADYANSRGSLVAAVEAEDAYNSFGGLFCVVVDRWVCAAGGLDCESAHVYHQCVGIAHAAEVLTWVGDRRVVHSVRQHLFHATGVRRTSTHRRCTAG